MQDLKKITTPFGLLDAETQEALRAHGGPYEVWACGVWMPSNTTWNTSLVTRVKPQPPKPREWWVDQAEIAFDTYEDAVRVGIPPLIHVREVLE